MTLPVIYLLRMVEPDVAAEIRGLLGEARPIIAGGSGPISKPPVPSIAPGSRAKHHVRALDALDCLPDSDAKSVLRILAQYVVRRSA